MIYKSLLLLSLSALFSFSAQSQKLFLGPEFGGNLIQVSNESLGREFQLGYYGGAAVEVKFSDAFSVSSGIYFSQGKQRTVDYDTSEIDLFGSGGISIPGLDLNKYSTINSAQTQHYIQIPILVSYKWENIGIFGGVYAGFMVGGKRTDHIVEFSPGLAALDLDSLDPTGLISSFLPEAFEEKTTFDNETDALRTFDYGFKAGLSYTMDQFSIKCSYNFGLPDFRSERGELDLQRHSFFQASITYMFPLSRGGSVSSIN